MPNTSVRAAAEGLPALNRRVALVGSTAAMTAGILAVATPAAVASDITPAVAGAVRRYALTVDAMERASAALPIAPGELDLEGEARFDAAFSVAHAAYRALLAVPCVTMADIKAKAEICVKPAAACGCDLDGDDARKLLRSFMGAQP